MSMADKTLREMGDVVKKLAKGPGETLLESNKAIKVADNFFGVPQAVYKMAKGDGFKEALETTFKNGDNLNVAKIAGSYMGVAAGARVLSGGGVYKDNRGQANLIGVPFV